MLYKKIAPFLLIGALVLSGCVATAAGATLHGGGKVELSNVQTGLGNGVAPTQATIAVNVNCHNKKEMFRSNINVKDKANGVKFTAHLPWTEIGSAFNSPIVGGVIVGTNTSCAEATDLAETYGYSITPGTIRHKGKDSGSVTVLVSQPGANPSQCGDMQVIQIDANGSSDVLPGGSYSAEGCLDRGKIRIK